MDMDVSARLSRPSLTRTRTVMLCLTLSALSAGTTADVSSTAQQPALCQAPSPGTNEFPTDVLVGTDVATLTGFSASNALITGGYQAEIGGATVTVSVTSDALTRTFQEPGSDPDRRTFHPICGSGQDLIAEGMVARRVSGGLLYWEPSTGVGGIPANLWIRLEERENTHLPRTAPDEHSPGTGP